MHKGFAGCKTPVISYAEIELKDPICIKKTHTLNVTNIVYSNNSFFRVLASLALFRGHFSIYKVNIDI